MQVRESFRQAEATSGDLGDRRLADDLTDSGSQSAAVETPVLLFVLRVDNLDMISATYGPDAAEFVMAEVQGALRGLLSSDAALDWGICPCTANQIGFLVRPHVQVAALPLTALRDRVLVWLAALGRTAILGWDFAVHVALSAACAELEGELDDDDLRCLLLDQLDAQVGPVAVPTPYESTRGILKDMAIAAAFYDELNREALQFAWEPVRSLDDDHVLYQRGQLCAVGRDGAIERRDLSYAVLERLGLAAAFDQFVLLGALSRLEVNASVSICVTVSARSCVRSHWWEPVLARLRCDGSVASRLFIGISCMQPLGPGVVELIDELRRLGCRIVLERLGSACSSIASLLALKPDVVTLDPLFLRLTCRQPGEDRLFDHMVGVAASVAPVVVVSGVDTPDQAMRALGGGAHWVMGAYAGMQGWRLVTGGVLFVPHLRADSRRIVRGASGPGKRMQ